MKTFIHTTFGLIAVLCLISCVSTAKITAVNKTGETDKNVQIYVDGKHLGNGTASYSDDNTVYSAVPFLELRKEGCKTHREKLDVQTNWGTAIGGAILAGAGIGIMSSGADGKIDPVTGLAYGLPMSVLGIVPLFYTREYVPFQKIQFQCVKVVEE